MTTIAHKETHVIEPGILFMTFVRHNESMKEYVIKKNQMASTLLSL